MQKVTLGDSGAGSFLTQNRVTSCTLHIPLPPADHWFPPYTCHAGVGRRNLFFVSKMTIGSIPLSLQTAAPRFMGLAAGLVFVSGLAQAQLGEFIIPSIRENNGTRFAYWDFFSNEPGKSGNYLYANPAALLGGEDASEIEDDDGNVIKPANRTNLIPPPPQSPTAWTSIVQDGTDTAFVTSAGGVYSYLEPVSFYLDYRPPHEGEVTNVIFQILTLGNGFNMEDIVLRYRVEEEGEEVIKEVKPQYRALDDPQSGDFYNGIISAFQWDLTGLGVGDFRIIFTSRSTSLSLREAQLDVVEGKPFQQMLGFLFIPRPFPQVRGPQVGNIYASAVDSSEERFFLPGQAVTVTAVPQDGMEHVGWLIDEQPTPGEATRTLTFAAGDEVVTAIFAPKHYNAWRYHWFYHASVLDGTVEDPGSPSDTGRPTNDHLDPRFSAPDKDPDGDGLDNFTEFAFGGDPYIHDSEIISPEVTLLEGDRLGLRYQQPATEAVQVVYRLQGSRDLVEWVDLDADIIARELQSNGYWKVTLTEKTADDTTPHPFLRVKASTP